VMPPYVVTDDEMDLLANRIADLMGRA
jgi:hypothetical protein